MTNFEFIGTFTLVFAVMAPVALLEGLAPLFAAARDLPGRRRANLIMTVQTLLSAFLVNVTVGLAAVTFPLASPQLLELAGLPPAAQFVLGVVALDFAFGYVAHRTMHAFPALWRVHRVHHSDPFVDVTTSYRTHPLEVAWRHAWLFATVWLLGVSLAALATFRMLSVLNGILEHANIRLPGALDTALSWVWVTPNMHKIHHSRRQAETDTNYGNLLPLYDRLFGTFVPTARATSVEYGLDDARPEDVRTVAAMLAMPWAPIATGRDAGHDAGVRLGQEQARA